MWISASSVKSYHFAQEFHKYYKMLGKENFSVKPYYALWFCAYCKHSHFKVKNDNCLSGGRYCYPDPGWGFEIFWNRFIIVDVEGPLLGKDYVKESLRQVCIYRSDSEKWWDYINLFQSQCINSTQAEKCTITLMELTKIDQNEVENCMKSSFQGTDEDIDDNDILKENFEKFKNEGIQIWPSILINKVLYKVSAFFKIVLLTISGHFRRKTSLRSNL